MLIEELAKELDGFKKMDEVGRYAVSRIQRRIADGKFKSHAPLTQQARPGGKILRNNSTLINSISYRITSQSVFIFTPLSYAKIQNDGGTVTAKKGALTIPCHPVVRTLQKRYGPSAKEVLSGLKAAGCSVWRQGRAIFYRKKGGRHKEGVMIYVLTKSITIPARPFMYLDKSEMRTVLDIIGGQLI